MSPTSPRCQPSGQQPGQHAPSSRPVSAAPQSAMVSPDAKGAASQVTRQTASGAVQHLPCMPHVWLQVTDTRRAAWHGIQAVIGILQYCYVAQHLQVKSAREECVLR